MLFFNDRSYIDEPVSSQSEKYLVEITLSQD
jgi:hypothetical protein